MQILPGSSDDERFINASGRFWPNGTGVMRYQRLLLEDAPITQIPQTFELLCKLAVALKPAERYGFGISGRQGPAIFISFTPWLCRGR